MAGRDVMTRPLASPTPDGLDAGTLAALLGSTTPAASLPPVRGATHHSGRVRAGDAFFALPGAQGHGIAHAEEALNAGAALVVSDRPHPRGIHVGDPAAALLRLGAWARGRLRCPVVAVTGSAGKTTAKALLRAALDGEASDGNLNTPHALAGRLMRAWADGDARPLVLELGIDRRGEMAELTQLVRPDVAVLTNLSAGHLDGLGDPATVVREKSVMLHGAARCLAADEAWQRLEASLGTRTVRYGLDAPHAEWRGTLQGDPFAPELAVHAPTTRTLPLPGLGTGLAESALGALAVADLLGVPQDDAAGRLPHAPLEPGRLQLLRLGRLTVLDDSYNANPASGAQALELLRQAPPPRVALLGDMLELGEESRRHHRDLGAATRGLDLVLAVGPEARALQEGNPAVRTLSMDDALAAVAELPTQGTVLVKASRGMRFERLVEALRARAPAGAGAP